MRAPAISRVNVQRRFALGLAEILGKHIAEQSTLFDGVVESDVSMGMRVEPMFWYAALSARAIVLFQQRHCVGFAIEGGEAEGAFAAEANQVPDERDQRDRSQQFPGLIEIALTDESPFNAVRSCPLVMLVFRSLAEEASFRLFSRSA